MAEERSRSYTHLKCGTVTTVSGDSFAQVCNPWKGVFGTVCAGKGCDGGVFKEFVWTDTDENLDDYRKRMQSESPTVVKFANSCGVALATWALGAVGGWFTAQVLGYNRFVGAGLGLFVAMQLMYWVVAPLVTRIDYRQRV